MSGFSPSVEAAQKALGAGAKIVAAPHPGGKIGVKFSLEEVAKRAWCARNDPRLIAWAGRALIHGVGCPYVKSQKNACTCGGGTDRPKGVIPQAQKLLDQFRAQTIYTQDPVATERIVSPSVTLCLDEHGLCMPARDCDDGVVAYTGATLAVGIPSRITGQCFTYNGVPEHVISEVRDPQRGWLRVDVSDDAWPVGTSSPGVVSEVPVELADNPKVTLSGGADMGEFIGVGTLPGIARGISPVALGQQPGGQVFPPNAPIPIGPLPVGNWDFALDKGIQTGLRYVVGSLMPTSHPASAWLIPTPWGPVAIVGDSSPWTEDDVRALFKGDFTIEKVYKGNVDGSWVIQGIALRTVPVYSGNVRSTDKGTPVVNVLEVFREHPAAPPAPAPGTTPASKWTPWLIGAGVAFAIAGAVYLYRARSAPMELPPAPARSRRRNPTRYRRRRIYR